MTEEDWGFCPWKEQARNYRYKWENTVVALPSMIVIGVLLGGILSNMLHL